MKIKKKIKCSETKESLAIKLKGIIFQIPCPQCGNPSEQHSDTLTLQTSPQNPYETTYQQTIAPDSTKCNGKRNNEIDTADNVTPSNTDSVSTDTLFTSDSRCNIESAISTLSRTRCSPQQESAVETIRSITSSSNISNMSENELEESTLTSSIKPSSTYGTQSSLKVLPFTNFYTNKHTGRYDYIVQSIHQLSECCNIRDETGFERVINDICLEDCVVMTPGLVKPKIGRQYYTDMFKSFIRNSRDIRHVIKSHKRIIINGSPAIKLNNTTEGQYLSIKTNFMELAFNHILHFICTYLN